jgi:hypothetical protein
MLNFAEQTGSGAVIFVWSFLNICVTRKYINKVTNIIPSITGFAACKQNGDRRLTIDDEQSAVRELLTISQDNGAGTGTKRKGETLITEEWFGIVLCHGPCGGWCP